MSWRRRKDQRIVLTTSDPSIRKFKEKIRLLTRINNGGKSHIILANLKRYLTGWYHYYKIVDCTRQIKDAEKLLRRRLRALSWERWRTRRNRYRWLRKLGVSEGMAKIAAGSQKSTWRNSSMQQMHTAMSNAYFKNKLGIPTIDSIQEVYHRRKMVGGATQ